MVVDIPENFNGAYYARIIAENHFANGLTPARLVLQDNCSKQNETTALGQFERRGISIVNIPSRSPDVNVIENMFAQIKKKLNNAAKAQSLTTESYDQFRERVRDTLYGFEMERVNTLIESLPRRMNAIIAGNGNRLKY